MNKLEMYKELSNEDKSNLTIYCIFDSIYDASRNNNADIDDDKVLDIQELSYELYLDDEYYNLSQSKIAYFITECYIKDDKFLDKVEDIDYSDILEAINDDDLDFYKEDETEMER